MKVLKGKSSTCLVTTKRPVPVIGVIDFQTPADELLLQACHDLLVILIPPVHFSLVGSKMGAHEAQGGVVEVEPDRHAPLVSEVSKNARGDLVVTDVSHVAHMTAVFTRSGH